MKTLLTLFGNERGKLQTEIDKTTSPEQVVKLVQSRIDGLEKSYIGGLSVSQVRLASFFLETLRQSISTLTAANETRIAQPEQHQNSTKSTQLISINLLLKGLQGLLSLSILGSLFSLTQDTSGAWMSILLMTVLIGLEVVLQLDKSKAANIVDATQTINIPQPIIQIDSNILLNNLADALDTIDRAVASAKPANKTLDSSAIEELPELLNIVQRLMGASFLEKPQMALELTKILPQILMEQGIQIQMYRPDDEASQREYFDFEPSIDRLTKDYITITPALLKGDSLLRRGRVIEPVYSED